VGNVEGRVAVLGVAIAGVVASIVEPGIYTLGSTVVGLTLVLVLWAYGTHPSNETFKERWAYSGVLAFTLILVFGYALNWLFFDSKCTEPPIHQMRSFSGKTCFADPPKDRYGDYDLAFFCVWSAMTMLAFAYRRWGRLLWARLRRKGQDAAATRSWWRRVFGG
jgi:hypothetical protein